jgi:hypothetical protein
MRTQDKIAFHFDAMEDKLLALDQIMFLII